MLGKVKTYIGDLRQEYKRINWPSRNEALRMSGVVIAISLVVAAFLGALDFLFVSILEKIIA